MRKPNLFIVGAPKCGTTSLYHYLENHPEIFLSSPKEVNFFSKRELEEQQLYYQDYKPSDETEYLNLFVNANSACKIIGEASVSYLYYPDVPKRIYKFNPDAKIIILLRDPVKRAWSHYLMDKRIGVVNEEFMKIFKNNNKKDQLHFQQYFLLGNYFSQIKRYLDQFGPDHIKVLFSYDLKKNTGEVIGEIYDFLGVKQIQINEVEEYNSYKEPKTFFMKKIYASQWLRTMGKKIIPASLISSIQRTAFETVPPKLEIADDRLIRNYYLDEVKQLEKLLKVDLSGWK